LATVQEKNKEISGLRGAFNVTTAAANYTVNADKAAKTVHGGYSTSWCGWSLWLDEYGMQRVLIAVAAGGATAAALSGIFFVIGVTAPLAGVYAAVAGIVGLGVALVYLCDNGNGVTLRVYFNVPTCSAR
jgi:acyl-CoA synthetase (AMP-forming)/AMP-acid ligase II